MRKSILPSRRGFTLVELLVVIAIIGILVGLLLPAVQAAREAARRMSCSNNFKQIGLGLHNYHSAYKQMPLNGAGSDRASVGNTTNNSNRRFLSFTVGVLPFIEQQGLWEKIVNPSQETTPGTGMPGSVTNGTWPPMGPCPWQRAYKPWTTQVPTYRCPSDPGVSRRGFGRTNYAACIGDATDMVWHGAINELGAFDSAGSGGTADQEWAVNRGRIASRGFFWNRNQMRFRDVLDGLANTIAAGEIVTSGGKREIKADYVRRITGGDMKPALLLSGAHIDPDRPAYYDTGWASNTQSNITAARGCRWADYRPAYSSFQTILPPNSPSGTFGGNFDNSEGIFSAGSRHQGGCHILMGDGAVIFMTDSVEAGDPNLCPVERGGSNNTLLGSCTPQNDPGVASPFGLWGALGTRDSGETIEEQLNQ